MAFHMLIDEAVANWGKHNSGLARAFDHKTMKASSLRLLDLREFPFTGEDPQVVARLREVAKRFALLQEHRHAADYDNSVTWDPSDTAKIVESVERAFENWAAIHNERIAQEYLVALLVRNRN